MIAEWAIGLGGGSFLRSKIWLMIFLTDFFCDKYNGIREHVFSAVSNFTVEGLFCFCFDHGSNEFGQNQQLCIKNPRSWISSPTLFMCLCHAVMAVLRSWCCEVKHSHHRGTELDFFFFLGNECWSKVVPLLSTPKLTPMMNVERQNTTQTCVEWTELYKY